jgi:hypothetical protein
MGDAFCKIGVGKKTGFIFLARAITYAFIIIWHLRHWRQGEIPGMRRVGTSFLAFQNPASVESRQANSETPMPRTELARLFNQKNIVFDIRAKAAWCCGDNTSMALCSGSARLCKRTAPSSRS